MSGRDDEALPTVDLQDIKPADGWRDLRLLLEMDLEVMRLQQAARDMATPPLDSAAAQAAARDYDRLFRAVEERIRAELLRLARTFASGPEAERESD